MTREEHYQKILALSKEHAHLMLRLPTSFGKTKIALDIMKEQPIGMSFNVLIVVPRLVLIDNWKAELEKWEFPALANVVFTTYVSFYKHAETPWDYIILDECHHFTENCYDASLNFTFKHVIAMSATITKEPRWRLKDAFVGIKEYSVTARDAIDDKILPDPKILLIPMMLDNRVINQVIIKQKSKHGQPVVFMYKDRFAAKQITNRPVHIRCTQQEWYNYNSEMIEWWKKQYIASQQVFQKNNWLRKAKERLDWLAEQKGEFVKRLLTYVESFRTLTFCTSVAQTEELGKFCINSKNKKAEEYLELFNEEEIHHITACNMLNEGVNLKNCQVGIYANIGSSEIVEAQRLGRLLRHPNPLLIIPYYVGTREEEIVAKMLRNYNPTLITRMFVSQTSEESIKNIIYGTAENHS